HGRKPRCQRRRRQTNLVPLLLLPILLAHSHPHAPRCRLSRSPE
ncbi:hypothetical protein BN1723_019923, partial [Verticillium longisporum]